MPSRMPPRARADRAALAAARVCVLALPVALLHARALAEILIAVTGLLFLLHAWAARDLAWLRRPFAVAAGAWWIWQVVCSAVGTGGLAMALVAFRLPLFALAAGGWALGGRRTRRLLWWMLALSALWIGAEAWQQYLTGTNLFGQPRWGDGALTGPFNRPRAGPALILILFPVLVPAAARLMASPRLALKLAALAAAVLGGATILLIGQRMPSVLLLLGMALTGILLPRLRLAAAAAVLLGVALLAVTPLIAPDTYQKLVLHTRDQLAHFVYSPYGELWVRAAVIAGQHPWIGLGFDGFRRGCADPGAVQGLPWLGVTTAQARLATDACNIHPHNYYLEAADNGGVPLLLLFVAMVAIAWKGQAIRPWIPREPGPDSHSRRLHRLPVRGGSPRWGPGAKPMAAGRSPTPSNHATRLGLLIGLTLALWPLASTSAFTSMPNAGWIFLLLGFAFAEADAGKTDDAESAGRRLSRSYGGGLATLMPPPS